MDCLGEPFIALLLSPEDEGDGHVPSLLPAPRAWARLPVSGDDDDGSDAGAANKKTNIFDRKCSIKFY